MLEKSGLNFGICSDFKQLIFFPKGGDIFTKKRICSLIELPDIQFNIPIMSHKFCMYNFTSNQLQVYC